MDNSKNVNAPMKGFKVVHKAQDGREREIARNAVDYGDGTVMVQYLDTDDVAIVNKDEIINVPKGDERGMT
jgi:hypothetical protein